MGDRSEYFRQYRRSEANKLSQKKYKQSKAGKIANRRYEQSELGKEAHQRYAQSELGKEASRRYQQSQKGKDSYIRQRDANIIAFKAREAVNRAIRDGKLTQEPCEVCGTIEKLEAHHEDYSKPLDVRWLCQKHHLEEHGKQLRSILSFQFIGETVYADENR